MNEKLIAWVIGDDTGASSITLWSVMVGFPIDKSPSIPYDSDDFGRCYRLLNLIPKSQHHETLLKAAKAYPNWKPFAREWEKLVELYEHIHPSPQFYELIEKCVAEAEHREK